MTNRRIFALELLANVALVAALLVPPRTAHACLSTQTCSTGTGGDEVLGEYTGTAASNGVKGTTSSSASASAGVFGYNSDG